MISTHDPLSDLLHLAREQFKLAAGRGGKDPVGVALLTRTGETFGGYALTARNPRGKSAAADALSLLTSGVGDTPREELPQKFEVAAIAIARPFNEKTLGVLPPDERTLRDLTNYIGIGDGQLVYLTTGNSAEIVQTFKL